MTYPQQPHGNFPAGNFANQPYPQGAYPAQAYPPGGYPAYAFAPTQQQGFDLSSLDLKMLAYATVSVLGVLNLLSLLFISETYFCWALPAITSVLDGIAGILALGNIVYKKDEYKFLISTLSIAAGFYGLVYFIKFSDTNGTWSSSYGIIIAIGVLQLLASILLFFNKAADQKPGHQAPTQPAKPTVTNSYAPTAQEAYQPPVSSPLAAPANPQQQYAQSANYGAAPASGVFGGLGHSSYPEAAGQAGQASPSSESVVAAEPNPTQFSSGNATSPTGSTEYNTASYEQKG